MRKGCEMSKQSQIDTGVEIWMLRQRLTLLDALHWRPAL